MYQVDIIGYVLEEPIENIETGEVEFKINPSKTDIVQNIIFKNNLALIALRDAKKGYMTSVKGHFESAKRLVADRVVFIKTEEKE